MLIKKIGQIESNKKQLFKNYIAIFSKLPKIRKITSS